MKLEARKIRVDLGGWRIVDDVPLSVAPGELVGLIGPNGAGKSTLMRAMLGLRPRSGGSVLVDGRELSELRGGERARAVSFLPQDRRVEWRLRARDVVMLGRYPHQSGLGGASAADHEAVDRALEAVEATYLTARPMQVLSGGEKSRVLLARALAVEAPVLMADEPTTALDPLHQLQVMEILRRLADEGRSVLVVLHDLSMAVRFMDRVVLMNQGRAVRDGAPSDVLSDEVLNEVYRIRALRGEADGRPWLLPWASESISNDAN